MVKLLIFPVIAVLTLIKWALLFVATFMTVFTNLLSGIVFVTAVLSYLTGQESGPDVLRMLAFAFGIFILPYAAGWCIERIAGIRLPVLRRSFTVFRNTENED